mmetsp:Transcript_38316/g.86213  ORF Transcript_38316/g.86213 Transcript_38316/m.86213 type:complete len:458 (+) Transcript_38316:242-1615(+)
MKFTTGALIVAAPLLLLGDSSWSLDVDKLLLKRQLRKNSGKRGVRRVQAEEILDVELGSSMSMDLASRGYDGYGSSLSKSSKTGGDKAIPSCVFANPALAFLPEITGPEDEDYFDFAHHNALAYQTIEEGIIANTNFNSINSKDDLATALSNDLSWVAPMGEEVGDNHTKIPIFDDIVSGRVKSLICATAFSFVEGLSGTCGYDAFTSIYASISGLLMQGFAVGVGIEDLNILECTDFGAGADGKTFGETYEFTEEFYDALASYAGIGEDPLCVLANPALMLAKDQIEEVWIMDTGTLSTPTPGGDRPEGGTTKSLFLYHSVLIFNKIEEAVSRGIGLSGFFALGKEIGEGHASFNFGPFEEGYEEFLGAAICETAFDLVEAMSGTCGYHKLESYYATAFGLLMQGFAYGVGLEREDLDILECTETEEGVESACYSVFFSGVDADSFRNIPQMYFPI